jgi:D-sedoheptulose 7-phosphate isomerase
MSAHGPAAVSDGAATGSLVAQLRASQQAVGELAAALERIERWGRELRRRLEHGGRLLVAGNGGSAALAHHLAGELVGRYDRERPGYSALALTDDAAGLTAIGNDYGFDRCFARQVEAHGRPGDVLVALTTSGRSPNLLTAADAARRTGVLSWAMTGPLPNPLAVEVDDVLAIQSSATACIQDSQQVAVHLLCLAFELAGLDGGGPCGT